MRRVGREHAADLEAALEAPEHVVERLDQPADLVGRAGMRETIAEVGLADASSAPDHLIDRAQHLLREQRAREADDGEDDQRHAEKEPAADPQRRVRVFERHRDLDGVVTAAHVDRYRHHADRLLAEVRDGLEDGVAAAEPREEVGRRRQTRRAERRAVRDHAAVQIGDLHELVEPEERGRIGRDLTSAQGRRRVVLERGGLERGQREQLVVDAPQHHAAQRPVGAEGCQRQHRCEQRDLPEPQAGLEAQ